MIQELKDLLIIIKKLREDTVYSYEKTELANAIKKLESVIKYYEDDGR